MNKTKIILLVFLFILAIAPGNVLAKQVLQQSDFQYQGAFEVPSNWYWGSGLANRYVNGALKLYTTDYPNSDLYEFGIPQLKTTAPYNTALNSVNFGNIYSGKNTFDDGSSGGAWGLFWDQTDQRMYWTFQNGYNAAYPNNASIGYSILNDSNHTGTGVKVVRMPSNIGSKVVKGITEIPAWFASQYTNGWRLGVGFGGYESAATSGPASMGPALFAVDPNDISNTVDRGYISSVKTIVNHPFNATAYTSPIPARRDKDYYSLLAGAWSPRPTDTYGWWQWADYIRQTAVWIDTPNKTGFLVAVRMATIGGVVGNTTQTFVTNPAPTATQATLTGPLPGLRVGDFVQVQAPHPQGNVRVAKITAINGLQISYTDPYGNPLGAVPFAPGGIVRGQFYGESDSWSAAGKHSLFVYDPVDLAKGAQGTLTPDQVDWKSTWDIQLPTYSYPLDSWSGLGAGLITGVTFDSSTNNLYILYRANKGKVMIVVYKVVDDITPPVPAPSKYSLTDFINLVSNWLKSIASTADIDNDGVVNIKDLGKMMGNWQ